MQHEASEIATKVRGVAAEKRLTQDGIADILGLSRRSVSARMTGNVSFTGAELLRLGRRLDVDPASFFPALEEPAA